MKQIIILTLVIILCLILVRKLYVNHLFFSDCKYKNDQLIEGKNYLSESKIVICGLIRDGGIILHFLKEKMYEITKYFKEYKILIVENDSSDNTRKFLLDWSKEDDNVVVLGCGINSNVCKLNLKKTIGHPVTTWRIEKMIYLRNLCIQYTRRYLYDYDLMMVYDLDQINNIPNEGLYHTGYLLKNDKVDGICSNGINLFNNRYYDTYAHKELDNFDDNIHNPKNTSCALEPRKVLSCFGGCTIYKISSIIDKDYFIELNSDGSPRCEHESFNKDLNIYYNPKWLNRLYFNP